MTHIRSQIALAQGLSIQPHGGCPWIFFVNNLNVEPILLKNDVLNIEGILKKVQTCLVICFV